MVDAAPSALVAGDRAPELGLEGKAGKVTLASLRGPAPGKYVVVYFYPKDKTPGCTREGQAFSMAAAAFEEAGAVVVGVSKDSLKTHASFAESCGITVALLSDPDLEVHRAYGAYGEKTMYGKKVTGTIRSTFLIAPDGSIARAFRNVKVDGHADAVLAAIRAHQAGDANPPTPVAKAKATRAKADRAEPGTPKKKSTR